jgi:amino acid transporter
MSTPDSANVMSGHTSGTRSLKPGAVGLPGILMQAITHIGPAIGLIAGLQFTASLAGETAPLVYLVALVIVLITGISVIQLAKRFPSAGGYYTYVSRTVSPSAGLFTSWMFLLYEPAACFVNLAFTSILTEQILRYEYGFRLAWWVIFVVGIVFVYAVMYVGVEISARTLIVLGTAEIVIIVALALTGLGDSGPGGVNAHPFNPGDIPSAKNFYLAIVFSIFTYAGFESVAPLAEESANPRRNLPRAVIWSILIMGAFYLVSTWGVLSGWGTQDMKGFTSSSQNPVFALADRLWGGAWILVLLALVNSAIALSLAAANATTRVVFALGRGGVLPAVFARIHPRFRTPSTAILFQGVLSLALGLFFGFVWLGPTNELFFFGTAITLGLIVIYCMGNFGVFLHYSRQGRGEFNLVLHVVCPLLSSVSLIWVAYKSVVPLPGAPVKYAPFLFAGWAIAAIALTYAMRRSNRGRWVERAGEIFEEVVPHTEVAVGTPVEG